MSGSFHIAVVPDCFYGHFYTFTCKLTHDSVTYNAYKEIHCAVDVLIRQSFFLLHGFKGGQGFVEVLLILSLVLFLLGDSFRKFLVGGWRYHHLHWPRGGRAAGLLLLACAGFVVWMVRRARRTLGKPHPCWRWYLAAVACLIVGLAIVPVMDYWPDMWLSLRLLHLHLNTLGFIGLTAIGTLQVLMPTILAGPDVEASARLRDDLAPAVAGVFLIALGAAVWSPEWRLVRWTLLLPGSLCLLYVIGRLALAWIRRYGWSSMAGNGAAASLAGAVGGLLLLVALGIAHGLGRLNGHDAVPAFIAGFLLPLVTGALTQLLPVWCTPGKRTAMRDRLHATLGLGGVFRVFVFTASGVALALGQRAGLWLCVAGLLSFVALVLRALIMLLLSAPPAEKIP